MTSLRSVLPLHSAQSPAFQNPDQFWPSSSAAFHIVIFQTLTFLQNFSKREMNVPSPTALIKIKKEYKTTQKHCPGMQGQNQENVQLPVYSGDRGA